MIPDKKDDFWRNLITGEIKVDFSTFALQMTVSSLSTKYKLGMIEMDNAINELHSLCSKYQMVVEKDIQKALVTK